MGIFDWLDSPAAPPGRGLDGMAFDPGILYGVKLEGIDSPHVNLEMLSMNQDFGFGFTQKEGFVYHHLLCAGIELTMVSQNSQCEIFA